MALTLNELKDLLLECGCCEIPECCPPDVVCQNYLMSGNSVGFVDPADVSTPAWKRTRYLRNRQVTTGQSLAPTISEYVPGDPSEGTYTSYTLTADWVQEFIQEWSQSYDAAYSGESGTCEESYSEYSFYCTATGGWIEKEYTPYFEGGVWDNFLSSQHEGVLEEIAGDPDPDNPGEVYPPCTMKTTHTITRWERVGGVVQLIPSTPEDPNPEIFDVIPGDVAGDSEFETIYEEPVTYEEWLTEIEQWYEDNITFEDVETCPPSSTCRAYKELGARAGFADQSRYGGRRFRFQIRLDKCCPWVKIRSEWDQVYYPEDEELPPVQTPQVWEWEGTPVDCSDDPTQDHFDEEDMWSPWSDPVFVEDGEYVGEVYNRNYQQKCYGPVPDFMPSVMGTYEPPTEEE